MFIPGPRLTTVFASRWKAMLWAITILIGAYFTATEGQSLSGPDTAAQAQSAQSDAAAPWENTPASAASRP